MNFLANTTPSVQYTTSVSKRALEDLWVTCFPEDGNGFATAFFRDYFCPEQGICIVGDGEVQSALYMLPCTYRVGETTGSLVYVYAMCTHPEHRQKGNLRRMLEFTEQHCTKQGIDGIVLHALDTSRRVVEAWGMKPLLMRKTGVSVAPAMGERVRCCDFETFYRLRTQFLDAKPAAIAWPRRELAFIYEDLCREGNLTFFQAGKGVLHYCAGDETDLATATFPLESPQYCGHIKMVSDVLSETQQASLYFNLLLK